MRKTRKNYSPPEKVAILRRHLIDRVPVSDLCDEYQLQPTLFYAWQKLFFENGAAAFERKNSPAESHHLRTIAALREKLQRKNEVVAELMEEHIPIAAPPLLAHFVFDWIRLRVELDDVGLADQSQPVG